MKKTSILWTTLFSVLVLAQAPPAAALDITPTGDGAVLAGATLSGGGVTVTSTTFTGEAAAAGTYVAGPLGIADGALFTSGAAVDALPPNDDEGTTTMWDGPGDPLCEALMGGGTSNDAVRLEIVFELQDGFDGIGFEYIVGSEEYPEYVDSEFNDAVGVFLDGVNHALDAAGNPITITGPFFSGTSVVTATGTEYDGSTPRLQQQVPLTPGEHTLIIVVCDASDSSYDTGLFLAGLAGCKGDCATTTWCGDGNVDDGEDCDDGNNEDGDGCDNTCKYEAICGDQICVVDEDCESCPEDCGECPDPCGDGDCHGPETCENCPLDCGECPDPCGDGECADDEDCETCPADCGECPVEPTCGDGECNGDETCEDCPADCGECPVEPTCGDGECNGDETCEDCPADCGTCSDELEEGYYVAGNGFCSASDTGGGVLPSFLLLALATLGLLGVRRRPFRRGLFFALIATVGLAVTLASAPAHAEQIETQAFRPSPFMQDYFTVGVGDTEGICKPWNIGMMLNYQNDPLVLHKPNGDVARKIVEHEVTANLLAAYRFVDWFALGLDVPVILFQDGAGLAGMPDPGVAGIGDIRLVPRFRLLRVADGLFSLGAELGIYFPTGKLVDNYMGRNGFGFMPKLLASFDFGRGGLALNLGFLAVTGEDKFANVDLGHALDTRLGGWVGLVPDKLDLVAELAMQMKLLEPFKNVEENPLEALLGFKWHAMPGLDVSAGAGAGITEGTAAPEFRVFAGVMYSPPCEKEPVPEPDPCGDGACKDGETCTSCPADCGECPPPPPERNPDQDDDGLCDPWVVEEGKVKEYADRCKPVDKCPTEPETMNSYQDDDGCPDQAVVIEKEKIVILQTVLFYFDETRIKEESYLLLDEVVKTLKNNPQLLKVRIEGHTDERGAAGYNEKLSSGRVETVLEYLVDHGIDRARLSSKGYGESKPLVQNAQTEEDHQKNRRVEFIILEQK